MGIIPKHQPRQPASAQHRRSDRVRHRPSKFEKIIYEGRRSIDTLDAGSSSVTWDTGSDAGSSLQICVSPAIEVNNMWCSTCSAREVPSLSVTPPICFAVTQREDQISTCGIERDRWPGAAPGSPCPPPQTIKRLPRKVFAAI